VLAAGGSTRLGSPKQLLPHRGTSLLRHAAETAVAVGAARVVVVVGAEAERLRAELNGLAVLIAENQCWAEGLSTSVRAGLDALEAATEPEALLFTTCDQPFVTPDLLRAMIAVYEASRPPVVACEYAGAVGVPALFDRALWNELRDLSGDSGARRIIERHLAQAVRVPFPEGAVDVDDAEDARRLR